MTHGEMKIVDALDSLSRSIRSVRTEVFVAGLFIALAIIVSSCAHQSPNMVRVCGQESCASGFGVKGQQGIVTVGHVVDGQVEVYTQESKRHNEAAGSVTESKIKNDISDVSYLDVPMDGDKPWPLCNTDPRVGETVTMHTWRDGDPWDPYPIIVDHERTVIATNDTFILLDQRSIEGYSGSPVTRNGCIVGIVRSTTAVGDTRIVRASVVTEFLEGE